jgi:O-antigen/teichoic acid export membrane protein
MSHNLGTSIKVRFQNFLNNDGVQRYSINTGWMFFGKVLSLIISFFSIAYVVRGLGPTNYGQLSFAISFVSIFSFIATLGIDQVLYRDLIKYPEKKSVYLGTSFVLKVTAGIISVLICLIAAYFANYETITFLLIAITSLTFVFIPIQIIGLEFQAEVKSKYPSIISLVTVITLNILKILTIAFGKGVIYMAFINLLEPILLGSMFLIFRKIYYKSSIDWKYDHTIAKQLLRDSWPMMFASAFALIYARIDQVFIKHLIDISF